MKPIIFSLASSAKHPGFIRFKRSCDKYGWRLDARHLKWPGERQMYQMFFDSFPRYRRDGFTHAIQLDGFDSIALGPPAELSAALTHYGDPAVLVSAEAGCWPHDYRRAEYGTPGQKFWFAHSPHTVDLRQALPERYINAPDHGYGTYQKLFADFVLDAVPGVAIDRDCRVVQALVHVKPWQSVFEIREGRVFNKITGSCPIWAHGNGKADMSWCPD